MPSFKSGIYAFVLKHTRKKSFTSVDGLKARLENARKTEDFTPPPDLAEQVQISERRVGEMPVFEISPKNGKPQVRIIYLHGGAFLFEITAHHWKFIAKMANRLNARFSVAIYPLAPETKAREMRAACMAHYEDVLGEKDHGPVMIMGDSAGGNLALVVSMMAAEMKIPVPAALVLISPPPDMTITNPDIAKVEKVDPWLAIPGLKLATEYYRGEEELSDWRISPTFGDIPALPPMQIFIGTRDILHPDTLLFAEKVRNAGCRVDLVEEKGMFHVWPLLEIPEAFEARDKIADFVAGIMK